MQVGLIHAGAQIGFYRSVTLLSTSMCQVHVLQSQNMSVISWYRLLKQFYSNAWQLVAFHRIYILNLQATS